uniref:CCHC-type domain-containing protein n=1 Tax=Fagus sylvatica TaxID=28930 RepID=A0A2N9H4K9_FAGSY
MLSEEVGADIGNRIGRFISNDEWKMTSKQAIYLRVTVEVPIDKPLRRGHFATSSEGDKVWIDYRYERLSSFCYRCGRLGHEERNCEKQSEKEGNEPPQYGEWLKASFGGKMMGVHGFEGYGSGEPKNKEMDHSGKRDVTTEDSVLITKSMESTVVVGESNHKEEESDRGRVVSEPINEGGYGFRSGGVWCPAPPGAMRLLSWNCWGLENPFAVQSLRHLVKSQGPEVLFLMETKLDVEQLEWIRDGRVWRLMGFYGRPEEDRKWQSWALLDHLNRMASFLVVGDWRLQRDTSSRGENGAV